MITESIDSSSRRKEKSKNLVKEFRNIVLKNKIKISTFNSDKINIAFRSFNVTTKYERAKLTADILSELYHLLPPKRRVWEAEHSSMHIFECGVLLLTHLYFNKT